MCRRMVSGDTSNEGIVYYIIVYTTVRWSIAKVSRKTVEKNHRQPYARTEKIIQTVLSNHHRCDLITMIGFRWEDAGKLMVCL